MTLIEMIDKNMNYIFEKDPYNVNAMHSLQYLKEQMMRRTCNNCRYWIPQHNSEYSGYCKRDDLDYMPDETACDFGCIVWSGKDEQ